MQGYPTGRSLLVVVALVLVCGTVLTTHQRGPPSRLYGTPAQGSFNPADGKATAGSTDIADEVPGGATDVPAPLMAWTAADATPCGVGRVAAALPHAAVNHTRCVGYEWQHSTQTRGDIELPSKRVHRSASPPTGRLSDDVVCPDDASLQHLPIDNSGHDTELHTSRVVAKYKGYAKRCVRNNGIMWAALTRGMHDRVYSIVLDAFMGLGRTAGNATQDLRASNATRRSVYVLDWGCGCGLTMKSLEALLDGKLRRHGRSTIEQRLGFALPAAPPYLQGVGVDVIGDAIAYANNVFRTPQHLYCRADGTQVGRWLPEGQFDWITSFAGLAHVPDASRCRVVSMLLRLLRPGGVMWSGYVPYETALLFLACTPTAPYEAGAHDTTSGLGDRGERSVRVSVVTERVAWANARVHRYYQNHFSVFWEKWTAS